MAEQVYNKISDLLAENNSPTQISARFTDQEQTKEPVGNVTLSRMVWVVRVCTGYIEAKGNRACFFSSSDRNRRYVSAELLY